MPHSLNLARISLASLALAATSATLMAPATFAQPSRAAGLLVASQGEQDFAAELNDDDPNVMGRHIDTYRLKAFAGQRVTVRIEAEEDLDTTLEVTFDNTSDSWSNDDFEGERTISQLTFIAPEEGEYEVKVSTFEPRQFGAYRMKITAFAAPNFIPMINGAVGSLDADDETRTGGASVDWYEIECEAGQRVLVEMEADDFDGFLVIEDPMGGQTTMDDASADNLNPRGEILLTRDGVYRFGVSSFEAEEQGEYEFSLNIVDRAGTMPSPDRPRVLGVFVGISEYGGAGDLDYCAADAERLARAMQKHFGMADEDVIVLTNAEAQADRIIGAIEDIGRRSTTKDTFVFFYSGHGTRITDDVNAKDAESDNEPDRLDEALHVRDGDLRDDRLSGAINAVPAAARLIALDACNSGGFAQDLSAPGNLALLSCPADALSLVAGEVEAGGYLSDALLLALTDELPMTDLDADGLVTNNELSIALRRRFAQFLVGGAIPTTRTDNGEDLNPGDWMGYQRLTIEDEGIHFDQPLFGF